MDARSGPRSGRGRRRGRFRHHSSRVPGARGSHPWATGAAIRQSRGASTPARGRTRGRAGEGEGGKEGQRLRARTKSRRETTTHSLDGLHDLVGVVAVVGRVGRAVVVVRLAEDEDVVALAERVLEDGDRAQVDVRVVAGGLAGRRAVKVPLCARRANEGWARRRQSTSSSFVPCVRERHLAPPREHVTRPTWAGNPKLGRMCKKKGSNAPLSSETDVIFLSTVCEEREKGTQSASFEARPERGEGGARGRAARGVNTASLAGGRLSSASSSAGPAPLPSRPPDGRREKGRHYVRSSCSWEETARRGERGSVSLGAHTTLLSRAVRVIGASLPPADLDPALPASVTRDETERTGGHPPRRSRRLQKRTGRATSATEGLSRRGGPSRRG